ncbi:hypothetical protein BKA61DRAFT_583856 [Leptodontidium sp. MPI-SDFR-AT-0119]|nr:hypothetical protein BKA61DRAFT_583856 [Leptodontidium sp. MPI-SDFR-AT-0119]
MIEFVKLMNFSSHLHRTRGGYWGFNYQSKEASHSLGVGSGAALFEVQEPRRTAGFHVSDGYDTEYHQLSIAPAFRRGPSTGRPRPVHGSPTPSEGERLKDCAVQVEDEHQHLELDEDKESPRRARTDVCGDIFDRHSAKTIATGGYHRQKVETGPEVATIMAQGMQPVQPRSTESMQLPSIHHLINSVPPAPRPAVPGPAIRLQMDDKAWFGMPHRISCFRRKMKAMQFFAWFRGETGRGGVQGPAHRAFA